jgi:transposase InsO family protein
VSDVRADGRRFRALNVIDMYTREAVAMEVAFSLPADAVTRALERAIAERGAQPEAPPGAVAAHEEFDRRVLRRISLSSDTQSSLERSNMAQRSVLSRRPELRAGELTMGRDRRIRVRSPRHAEQ